MLTNELATFIQLVETLSFTKTAARQRTTQATISRRIKDLEQNLGLQLVKRSTRNITITDAGQKLYIGVKKQEEELTELISQLSEDNNQIKGTIKISLPHSVAYEYVSPQIGHFICKHPDINLSLVYQNHDIDLINERVDLAIFTHLPKQQTTIVKLLAKFKIQLYCTPSYIKKYGQPKEIGELKNHAVTGWIKNDFVPYKNLCATNIYTDDEIILENRPRIMVNSSLHTKQLAIGGEIIIGAWDSIVKEELANGQLVKILPEYTFGELPYYLIRLPNSNNARIDAFIQFITDCFANIEK